MKKIIILVLLTVLAVVGYSQDKPFVTAGGGIIWQKKYDSTAVANNSGIGYITQTSSPTDTTKMWLDDATGANGVWPLKQRLRNSWRIIGWYDPIANFFSDKRPLYVLGSGQSNMIYRPTGGDLAVDNRVIEWVSGAWQICNRVAGNANNIAMQFSKQVAKHENRIVRFAVVAEASQPLSKWLHDSTKTDEIAALVRLAKIDSFDVILYRQGEQNVALGYTEAQYKTEITQVFNSYRDSTWFGKSGRVLLGGINESFVNTGVFNFYQHVNNPENSGLGFVGVSMLGLSRANGIHIDGISIDTVGKRYYEAWAGQSRQNSLEKTDNISIVNDNQLLLTPWVPTKMPALRLGYAKEYGFRGGVIKLDTATSTMRFAWNPVNNGTDATDSMGLTVNLFNQIGIDAVNGTTSTNLSAFNISTTKSKAFSITNWGTNTPLFQLDNKGRSTLPIQIYNQFTRAGELRIHSLSGDVNNGVFRKTRANITGGIPSYSGDFQWLDGSANKSHFGTHSSVDTTSAADSIVMTMPMSGDRIGIKKITPTSTLDVGGSFSTAYVAKTANYTATITDHTIECTANTFTVTLPTAVGITGRIYTIVNSGAGTITIGTTSSQTFANVTATPTSLTLSPVGAGAIVSYTVKSNGINWIVTAKVKNE